MKDVLIVSLIAGAVALSPLLHGALSVPDEAGLSRGADAVVPADDPSMQPSGFACVPQYRFPFARRTESIVTADVRHGVASPCV